MGTFDIYARRGVSFSRNSIFSLSGEGPERAQRCCTAVFDGHQRGMRRLIPVLDVFMEACVQTRVQCMCVSPVVEVPFKMELRAHILCVGIVNEVCCCVHFMLADVCMQDIHGRILTTYAPPGVSFQNVPIHPQH